MVVQDMGGFPSTVDGILGLLFLECFAAIDMNFSNGNLYMYYEDGPHIPPIPACLQGGGVSVARGFQTVIPRQSM